MVYRHLIKDSQHTKFWKQLFTNELGRFEQGVDKRFKGVDTNLYINYDNISSECHKYNYI